MEYAASVRDHFSSQSHIWRKSNISPLECVPNSGVRVMSFDWLVCPTYPWEQKEGIEVTSLCTNLAWCLHHTFVTVHRVMDPRLRGFSTSQLQVPPSKTRSIKYSLYPHIVSLSQNQPRVHPANSQEKIKKFMFVFVFCILSLWGGAR